jgi:hypothetical protein
MYQLHAAGFFCTRWVIQMIQKFHYGTTDIHHCHPLNPILSPFNPADGFTTRFSMIYFDLCLGLQTSLFPRISPTKILCVGYLSLSSYRYWLHWPTYYLKSTKWEVTLTLWDTSCVWESSLTRSDVSNGRASHSSNCCALKAGTQFPPGSVTWTKSEEQASDIQIQF